MIYGLRDVQPECQEPTWKIGAELETTGEGLSHAGGWMRQARKRARTGRAIRRQCRDLVARGGERSGRGRGGERLQEGGRRGAVVTGSGTS